MSQESPGTRYSPLHAPGISWGTSGGELADFGEERAGRRMKRRAGWCRRGRRVLVRTRAGRCGCARQVAVVREASAVVIEVVVREASARRAGVRAGAGRGGDGGWSWCEGERNFLAKSQSGHSGRDQNSSAEFLETPAPSSSHDSSSSSSSPPPTPTSSSSSPRPRRRRLRPRRPPARPPTHHRPPPHQRTPTPTTTTHHPPASQTPSSLDGALALDDAFPTPVLNRISSCSQVFPGT